MRGSGTLSNDSTTTACAPRGAGAPRDMLAHVYFQVDLTILWDVVETKLDPLAAAVERMLDEDQPLLG